MEKTKFLDLNKPGYEHLADIAVLNENFQKIDDDASKRQKELEDHKIKKVSASEDGHMTKEDKKKIDGIATGANNYTLPVATVSVLGGIKVGKNLSISDGILSGEEPYTLPVATPSKLGGVKTKKLGRAISYNQSSGELEIPLEIKQYSDLSQLGLTGFVSTLTIAKTMEDFSSLSLIVSSGSIITDAPYSEGTLVINRINRYRCTIIFFDDSGYNFFSLARTTSDIENTTSQEWVRNISSNGGTIIKSLNNVGDNDSKYSSKGIASSYTYSSRSNTAFHTGDGRGNPLVVPKDLETFIKGYQIETMTQELGYVSRTSIGHFRSGGNDFGKTSFYFEGDREAQESKIWNLNHKNGSFETEKITCYNSGTIKGEPICTLPVGIMLLFMNEVNPSVVFEGTTWGKMAEGRTIRGAGPNYSLNTWGGNDYPFITQANLPPINLYMHNHTHNPGTMNITANSSSSYFGVPIEGNLSGAFYGSYYGEMIFGGQKQPGYFANFDASRTWTGNTGGQSDGTVPLGGAGNPLDVRNAYHTANVWYRIS